MNKRKRMALSIAFLAIVFCSSQGQQNQINQKIKSIETRLFDLTGQSRPNLSLLDEMASKNVPGVSIAIVDAGKIDWAKGYGVLKGGTSETVTTETVFEAASTTKILTSVIMLTLVEEGLIGLDEDVNKYLKSWKIPDNAFTKSQKVTLRHILSHRAGFNRPEGGFSYDDGKLPTLANVLNGEAPAQNEAAVIEFVPGTKWQYSNIGYIVLQMLIEDITGKTYAQVALDTIIEPLKLKSSTFNYPLSKKIEKILAETHDEKGNPRGHGLHPSAFAHGGLITSPIDLAKFAIELMNSYQGKSEILLSQKTAKLLFTKIIDLDPSEFGGIEVGMGLGVLLRGEGEDICFIMAGQNLPGSTSFLMGFPRLGKGAVIMTNGINGELLQLELIGAIGRVYDWPESKLF